MLRHSYAIKLVQLLAAVVVVVVNGSSFILAARRPQQRQSCFLQHRTIRSKNRRIVNNGRQIFSVAALFRYGMNDDDNRSESTPVTTNKSLSSTTTLMSKSVPNDPSMKPSPAKKTKNLNYIRPSAAIERGSGFFVPGLEGYKVRLFVGSIVVTLTVLLHYYQTNAVPISNEAGGDRGNNFAELLALFYGLLVLLQGSIEARKDSIALSNINSGSNTRVSGKSLQVYQQQWFLEVSDIEWREKVEWVASTYLSLTGATDMILIGPGKIVFSLGTNVRSSNSNNDTSEVDNGNDDESRGCNGALATLAQSTSGCLSLPMNHVAVQTLVRASVIRVSDRIDSEVNNNEPRCVVLQQINDQLCWMMISSQLLASFTTNDLQWLGQLAQYTNPE